ncbi:hypothetical protein TNCT_641151 [Trichonephila clavata]|uniref:Uncharacterized protein n=1 Tax=Trichonephila clavata TaxID=2740835 RepID=A0A8X6GAN3_TRICU|nr:hypothetical protein TNCT_641151 [Trichonephila clavata]
MRKQTFHLKGYAIRTTHTHGALSNPHSTRPQAARQSFIVNAWASIVGDSLLGIYILPPRLDSDKFLVFLREVLPKLLPMPPHLFGAARGFIRTWAPFHYGRCARDHFDHAFPNKWIVLGSLRLGLSDPLEFFSRMP